MLDHMLRELQDIINLLHAADMAADTLCADEAPAMKAIIGAAWNTAIEAHDALEAKTTREEPTDA